MGVYIVTGRRVASGSNSLDNLCIAVAVGWLVQSLFLGVPAVSHVIHPKSDATWALAPGGPWKLLALLFVISLMASFIPYAVEQITLRRTTSGAFSVMQSINAAMAVAVGLAFGEIPDTGEVIGVALVICAVIVTFSGDVPWPRASDGLPGRQGRLALFWTHSARCIHRAWYDVLLLRFIA